MNVLAFVIAVVFIAVSIAAASEMNAEDVDAAQHEARLDVLWDGPVAA